jgi:AcrR family transcriptional regulator
MPKPTFIKLPDAKRKRFLKEAYKEFAIHSLAAASVTNMVKSLGIAKGSVYQYFDDKEDLYSFLVTNANQQLNQLLDKACVYHGEDFYDWYVKLLMVKVKFLLSFPQFAALFMKLVAESGAAQRLLSRQMEASWLSRITQHLPGKLYDSPTNNLLLTRSPLLIFDMLSENIDLDKLILAEDPIFLEANELVTVCTEWVNKLKQGL